MEDAARKRKAIHDEAEKVRAEGAKYLSSDLESILDDPESSDVIFVCKDGDKVHAVRWLLSLRCPVFKPMFSHEMAEKKASEISLPQFSSAIMRCIFEYLYTGSMKAHPLDSWKMGFELISAAHFFNIPAVEVVAQDFLWTETSNVCKGGDRGLITDMLNDGLEFYESWEGRDAMLLELTDDWFEGKEGFHKLSENALDYILSKLKDSRNGHNHTQAVTEYNSFRQIVMWTVYQKLSPSSAETHVKLRKALPVEKDDPLRWTAIFESPLNRDEYTRVLSNASDSHDPTVVLKSLLGIETNKESLQRLLDHIDWSRIPTMLLQKVVWPLEVVSPNVVLRALGIQALCLPVKTWAYGLVDWKHSNSLTSDCTTITCKSRDGWANLGGRAIASLPMARLNGTYEWQIEIEENQADCICLGFIRGSDAHPWNEDDFENGDLLQSSKHVSVCRVISGQGRIYLSTKEPTTRVWKDWVSKGVEVFKKSLVSFTLDISKRTCYVSFNGKVLGWWHDLCTAVYYPVVEFTGGRFASIELKFAKGFHC